jgi:hypothetical protein
MDFVTEDPVRIPINAVATTTTRDADLESRGGGVVYP